MSVRHPDRTIFRATPVTNEAPPVHYFDMTTESVYYRELRTASGRASLPVHTEPQFFTSSEQAFEHFLHDGFLRSSIYKFLLSFGTYNE